jgi:hypothetical protein
MICSAKPVLTEDLCVVPKKVFSIACYMCEIYIWRKAKHIHKRQTHLLVFSEPYAYGSVIWHSVGRPFSRSLSLRHPLPLVPYVIQWFPSTMCPPPPAVCVHEFFVKGHNSQSGFRPLRVSSYFPTRKLPVRYMAGLGLMWSSDVW